MSEERKTANEMEFTTPRGLRPSSQLDARFPISYQTSVPEAMRVIIEYFAALSQRDMVGIAKSLHFPFALYEDIDPVVVESESALLRNPPATINVTGKGETQVMEGSYDLLECLELLTFSPVAAVLTMSFMRYAPSGHKLALCDGLYVITNNDGKWAIELFSTIFTPSDYIVVRYPEVENAVFIRSRDWMLGYYNRDQAMLNRCRVPGKSAGIDIYGPRDRARNARNNIPMAGYVTKGIKSRLRVTEVTQEQIDASDANFEQFAGWAGGGIGEWSYSLGLPDVRVLHATVNKAHTMGGYIRFVGDHQVVSETRSPGILVYRDGRWGMAGGLGNMMLHHDRSNSNA
jgi:hypothetical protein